MTGRARRAGSLGLLAALVLGGGTAVALGGADDPEGAETTGPTVAARVARPLPATTTTTAAPGERRAAAAPGPLAGRTVVVDPGHNGGNGAHPAQIARPVDVGNGRKACNTTGTESARGLTESRLNLLLAAHVRRALEAEGARVRVTRTTDGGVGPCVDRRARIANAAKADAAVSIHGDGGPAGGRGFHVILPGRVPQVDGHDAIVGASARLGRALRASYRSGSGLPYSTYLGRSGLDVRTDLGGLNLLTVPGVMIETGNMRNATDAARMSDAAWRRRAGRAIAAGVERFLTGESAPAARSATSRGAATETAEAQTDAAESPAATTRRTLRRAAAAAVAAGGPGTGAAVGTTGPGSVARAGDLARTHAWSTAKVPVLAAVLRARRAGELAGGTTPTAEERRLATAALTSSDNASAEALFDALKDRFGGVDGASDAVEAALLAGSGRQVAVNRAVRAPYSTFGQTSLALTDGVRFYAGLAAGCVLGPSDTTTVTGLMRRVVPAQRWGLGTPSWGATPAFKGGWGPEAGGRYVAVQYGTLRSGSRGLTIGIAAQAAGGLDTVTPILTRMARAAARVLPVRRWPPLRDACPTG